MIRIVLLEFEDTLITSASGLYPGVMETLSSLQKFETDGRDYLQLCLFSLTPEVWQVGGKSPLDGLRARLDSLGLSAFFDPIGERVVIGSKGDVGMQRILDAVFSRASSHANLDEIVFVSGSESVSHAIDQNRLRSFRFSQNKLDGSDQFSDWVELPLLLANLFDSTRQKNREIALRFYLSNREHLSLASLRPSDNPDVWEGQINTWHSVSSRGFSELSDVNVKIPGHVTIELDSTGRIEKLQQTEPSVQDKEEAQSFVESLAQHRQIATESNPELDRATHAIETDAEGKRYLVRKRFSAV